MLPPAQLRFQLKGEVRDLFDGACGAQEHRLREVITHKLDADRETFRETAGDTDGGDTGEVHGDGAEVLIVHGERIVYLLADPEGHGWGGRGDEHIVPV